MTGSFCPWIDWALARRTLLAELPGRFVLAFLLAAGLFGLLLSGGADRYLALRWPLTAVLAPAVTPEEGRGMAEKLARLPAVWAAEYRDSEAAWREFAAAYPGLDALREGGGSPLPAYVEIRLRPERMTAGEVGALAAALRSLPQVERVLDGGEALARALAAARWVDGALWAAEGVLAAVCLWILFLQEKGRAGALARDAAFLVARGVPAAAVARRRAACAAGAGFLLGAAAGTAAAGALHLLWSFLPGFAVVVGPPGDLAAVPKAWGAAAFPAAWALLSGAASRAGWAAARVRAA